MKYILQQFQQQNNSIKNHLNLCGIGKRVKIINIEEDNYEVLNCKQSFKRIHI